MSAAAPLRELAALPAPAGGRMLLRRAWPRANGRLLLEYAGPGGAALGARWSAADSIAAGDAALPAIPVAGGPVLLHVDGRDAGLPGLRALTTRPGSTVLSHSPGRRAAVRLEDGTFAKAVRPSRALALLAATRAASGLADDAFDVAAPLWSDLEQGVVVCGALDGRPLRTLLATPRGPAAAAGLGAALGALHAAAPPVALPRHDAAAEARLVATIAARTGEHVPALRGALAAAAEAAGARLCRLPQVRAAPLHRDLHDGQVLVGRDGRVAIIDFDTLAAGDPALDLGNLLAHLDLRVLQGACGPARAGMLATALLAGHAEPGTHTRTGAYAEAARVRLACVYALRPRWSHLSRPLLRGPGNAERAAAAR